MERAEQIIIQGSGGWFPNSKLKNTQQAQIWDELLLKEKEFANEIYIQRCREKYL